MEKNKVFISVCYVLVKKRLGINLVGIIAGLADGV